MPDGSRPAGGHGGGPGGRQRTGVLRPLLGARVRVRPLMGLGRLAPHIPHVGDVAADLLVFAPGRGRPFTKITGIRWTSRYLIPCALLLAVCSPVLLLVAAVLFVVNLCEAAGRRVSRAPWRP